MLTILLLALSIVIVLALPKNSKSFINKSFAAALFLGIISILFYELFNGPHAECGTNDSVAPCDYIGRVVFDLPLVLVPTFVFWIIILSAELFGNHIRRIRTWRK